jgi:hypothetical protein
MEKSFIILLIILFCTIFKVNSNNGKYSLNINNLWSLIYNNYKILR